MIGRAHYQFDLSHTLVTMGPCKQCGHQLGTDPAAYVIATDSDTKAVDIRRTSCRSGQKVSKAEDFSFFTCDQKDAVRALEPGNTFPVRGYSEFAGIRCRAVARRKCRSFNSSTRRSVRNRRRSKQYHRTAFLIAGHPAPDTTATPESWTGMRPQRRRFLRCVKHVVIIFDQHCDVYTQSQARSARTRHDESINWDGRVAGSTSAARAPAACASWRLPRGGDRNR